MAHPALESIHRRRWWTLAVLSLSLIIIGLDNTILNVALPTVQQHFNASTSSLQWMVDSYILVYAGLLLILGSLGDKFGRKRALQVGLILFAGFSVFAAYAQTSEQLIIARALMGIGGALIMPSTLSVLVNVFPREERGRAISIWAGMAAIGIPLGPLMGGWLLEHFWWGSVFMVNVPICLVAFVAGMILIPESRDPITRRIDWIGAFFSVAGLSLLVYAIIEAPNRGWTDWLVLSAFAAAVVLIWLFVWFERRSREPMLDMHLFKNPRFSAGAGAIALAFMAMFGSIFLLTQYLQFILGYSALEAGVRFLPFALGMMVGAPASHTLVKRFGSKWVIAGGMFLLAAMLALAFFFDAATPYWAIACWMVGLALGMANTMAPATDSVMGAVSETRAGIGSATNDAVRQIGGALGVAILGSVMHAVYSSGMTDAVTNLPASVASVARDSIGAVLAMVAQVGETGTPLMTAAVAAFLDGLGISVIVGAGIILIGVILVIRFLPAREAPHAPDGKEQS